MARNAKQYSAEFVKSFEDKFYSMNPSVKEGGTFQFRDVVKTMRLLNLDPNKSADYPQWMFSNKVSRGIYKLPKTQPLIVGQVPAKAPKVKANKTAKKSVGPSVNSQRWASGKAPLKTAVPKAAKGDVNPAAFDDSVEYEDVMGLRNEFGLGEFRNTLD
jgi:hypothetical protein